MIRSVPTSPNNPLTSGYQTARSLAFFFVSERPGKASRCSDLHARPEIDEENVSPCEILSDKVTDKIVGSRIPSRPPQMRSFCRSRDLLFVR